MQLFGIQFAYSILPDLLLSILLRNFLLHNPLFFSKLKEKLIFFEIKPISFTHNQDVLTL